LWAGDPAFIDLLDRLRRGCCEFGAWWEAHDVRNVRGGEELLHHPRKARLRFEHASLQANDDPALKLIHLHADLKSRILGGCNCNHHCRQNRARFCPGKHQREHQRCSNVACRGPATICPFNRRIRVPRIRASPANTGVS